MRVLYVAYPLQPVSAASCGGAEQVLWTLEREIHRRGHETTVAACEGSEVSGGLIVTGDGTAQTDSFPLQEARHRERVLQAACDGHFDLVHDHSGHLWPHAAALQTPVLATLHLPREFYEKNSFTALAPNVFFNCVSESQHATFTDLPQMMAVVRNGIALDRFPLVTEKQDYLLWLGRICPEKAPHLAIHVARTVGLPLVIAGQVYPFSYHQQYFEREVKPHLCDARVRFVESPPFAQKLALLQNARTVLITSLASETSSMVALEAMACGTPVIARGIGALPEVVEDGVTGILVESDNEFAAAVAKIADVSPHACRSYVEANFSSGAMADAYESLYSEIMESCIPGKVR